MENWSFFRVFWKLENSALLC